MKLRTNYRLVGSSQPAGAEALLLVGSSGTAEAVPFPKPK